MTTNKPAIKALLKARQAGLTLRQAAALAGVHVATVCRWQKRDPGLRQALAKAATEARPERFPKEPRPSVRWRRDCPLCQARVVVRSARGKLRFWRCGRWPRCQWASWRPRAPRNCRRCGSPCYWSHSRKSSGCSNCGLRIWTPLTTRRNRQRFAARTAKNEGLGAKPAPQQAENQPATAPG